MNPEQKRVMLVKLAQQARFQSNNPEISSPFMAEYRSLRRRQFWTVVLVLAGFLAAAIVFAVMLYETNS